MTLQAVLILVLGAASAFLVNEGSFVNTTIHDNLAAQHIFFPPATAAVPGGSLDPAEFPDLQQYAGQQVLTGEQAKAYANGFLGRHLAKVANGLTYAQIDTHSGDAAAIAKANGQKATLFQGETLRNMLLNAWGWSMLATYTTYGGVGLMLAAFVVVLALAFEVLAWRRDVATVKVKASGKLVAAA
jgi:hypothetical protein